MGLIKIPSDEWLEDPIDTTDLEVLKGYFIKFLCASNYTIEHLGVPPRRTGTGIFQKYEELLRHFENLQGDFSEDELKKCIRCMDWLYSNLGHGIKDNLSYGTYKNVVRGQCANYQITEINTQGEQLSVDFEAFLINFIMKVKR